MTKAKIKFPDIGLIADKLLGWVFIPRGEFDEPIWRRTPTGHPKSFDPDLYNHDLEPVVNKLLELSYLINIQLLKNYISVILVSHDGEGLPRSVDGSACFVRKRFKLKSYDDVNDAILRCAEWVCLNDERVKG